MNFYVSKNVKKDGKSYIEAQHNKHNNSYPNTIIDVLILKTKSIFLTQMVSHHTTPKPHCRRLAAQRS